MAKTRITLSVNISPNGCWLSLLRHTTQKNDVIQRKKLNDIIWLTRYHVTSNIPYPGTTNGVYWIPAGPHFFLFSDLRAQTKGTSLGSRQLGLSPTNPRISIPRRFASVCLIRCSISGIDPKLPFGGARTELQNRWKTVVDPIRRNGKIALKAQVSGR